MTSDRISREISEYFSRLGKKGGKKGGRARAQKLTAEERSESARSAVLARWAKVKTRNPQDD